MLGVAALGMAVTGLTSYVVERERADARIDEGLAQEVAEFRELATNGIDPDTGQPIASVTRLLYVALLRNVPSTGESLLGIVDGQVEWLPPYEVDVEPNTDASFVGTVATIDASVPVQARTFESDHLGSLRYVAVPVGPFPDDPSTGVYVVTVSRDAELAAINDSYRTYALVAVGSLVLIGAVGWLVAGQLLRPIRLLREAADQITDTDLSERLPAEGRDDISDLTRTVNRMLDRLEAAFAAHRSVLDDAGHELRTPLTIIRGHLEVMDISDATDVGEVRTLVLDEVDRMQRLVEDLVILAKADRLDFIQPAAVDVGRLTDDVFDKARSLGDRAWLVDARVDDVTAQLDEQRITQAMLQLAANAVRFSSDGDEVAVGSAVRDGVVRLWVRDRGVGIDPADAERIFDRFARAGDGRGSDGSGLGLAIVRAIVEAHGGRVSLVSAPGAGSTFVAELPMAGPAVNAEGTTDGGRG